MTTQDNATHDEILAGLTEAERAAMAAPDDAPDAEDDEDDQPAAEAAKTEEKSDAKPDDAAATAAADAAAAATAAATTEPAAPAAAEQESTASAAPQPAPVFVAEAVADAEAKLADIGTKKDDVITRFDNGDITAKEMQKEIDVLNKQEREIERAQDRAKLAAEMNDQAMRNAWVAQANQFATDNGYTDARRFKMLDDEVKAVASTKEAETMNGAQILAAAHKNLVDAGLMVVKAAAAPAPAPKKPVAEVPKPNLPPSLHAVPAAAQADAGEGRFAHLRKLNGFELEKARAKMSEADWDAFMLETD